MFPEGYSVILCENKEVEVALYYLYSGAFPRPFPGWRTLGAGVMTYLGAHQALKSAVTIAALCRPALLLQQQKETSDGRLLCRSVEPAPDGINPSLTNLYRPLSACQNLTRADWGQGQRDSSAFVRGKLTIAWIQN